MKQGWKDIDPAILSKSSFNLDLLSKSIIKDQELQRLPFCNIFTLTPLTMLFFLQGLSRIKHKAPIEMGLSLSVYCSLFV